MRPTLLVTSTLLLLGCDPAPPLDGPIDAAIPDAGRDAQPRDARVDATPDLALDPDAAPDLALDPDAAPDAWPDLDPLDLAPPDLAPPDLSPPDLDPLDLAPPDLDPLDASPDASPDAEPDAGPPPFPTSDPFDDDTLADHWRLSRPDDLTLELRDGALHLTPDPFTLWLDRTRGPFIYQPAAGDLRVTATLSARSRATPDAPPAAPPAARLHLGGLMARDPQSPPENNVLIAVGHAFDGVAVLVQDTLDGRSDLTETPAEADARLRICRLGDTLTLYRFDDGWQLTATYARPALPPLLHYGLVAYADAAMPDLTVTVDAIDYAPVEGRDDCVADEP